MVRQRQSRYPQFMEGSEAERRHVLSGARGNYSIPAGAIPSAIPVTLVCGPPGSGKSTYVREHARSFDTVIDLDTIKVKVGGVMWDDDYSIRRKAMAYRDQVLLGLKDKRHGRAFIIASAPSQDEREAWCKTFGNVTIVEIATSYEVCVHRIMTDPRRAHVASSLCDGARKWWLRRGAIPEK